MFFQIDTLVGVGGSFPRHWPDTQQGGFSLLNGKERTEQTLLFSAITRAFRRVQRPKRKEGREGNVRKVDPTLTTGRGKKIDCVCGLA